MNKQMNEQSGWINEIEIYMQINVNEDSHGKHIRLELLRFFSVSCFCLPSLIKVCNNNIYSSHLFVFLLFCCLCSQLLFYFCRICHLLSSLPTFFLANMFSLFFSHCSCYCYSMVIQFLCCCFVILFCFTITEITTGKWIYISRKKSRNVAACVSWRQSNDRSHRSRSRSKV